MKEQILQLAQKYNIDHIVENVDSLNNDFSLKVGFLGEWNSGKSTLINATLGKKILPAMQKPTSKSIVEIHPNDGKDTIEYFRKIDEFELEKISALEFSDIALGKEEGTAVLKTKENEYVRNNFVLIDTPGISSLDAMDADITFGYLPFIDGAVICHDINKGDLTKSIYNFILKSEVQPLINNFVFVLTHIDTKPKQDVDKIKDKIINTLKELSLKNNLKITNIEEKIVLVSGEKILQKDTNYNLNNFSKAYEINFVEKSRLIHKSRLKKELEKISYYLIELLKDKKINFDLSNEELAEKINKLETEITEIENDRKNSEKLFTDLEDSIENRVSQIVDNYLPLYEKANQEKLSGISKDFVNEIITSVESNIKNHLKSYRLPKIDGIITLVENTMLDIDKINELSKTAATAAIMAGISAGTTVAANAAEAAAGGTGRVAAKKMSKKVAEEAAKKAALEVTKKAKFLKFMGFVAEIIKDINPVEPIGDYLADLAKKKKLEGLAKGLSGKIADSIVNSIRDEYQIKVIQPLIDKIKAQKLSIEFTLQDKKKSEEELRRKYRELERDINSFENIVKDEYNG